MRFVLASNNQAKTREIAVLAQQMGQEIVNYQEILGQRLTFPPETTDSQAQNALGKASFIHHYLPDEYVLADDSGLYLAAFPDRFGVVTAREFQQLGILGGQDEQNYLLSLYRGQKNRAAYLLAEMAVVTPQGDEFLSRAKGGVAMADRIGHGPDLDGLDNLLVAENHKILSEMPLDEVIEYHQRSRALKQLLALL